MRSRPSASFYDIPTNENDSYVRVKQPGSFKSTNNVHTKKIKMIIVFSGFVQNGILRHRLY